MSLRRDDVAFFVIVYFAAEVVLLRFLSIERGRMKNNTYLHMIIREFEPGKRYFFRSDKSSFFAD